MSWPGPSAWWPSRLLSGEPPPPPPAAKEEVRAAGVSEALHAALLESRSRWRDIAQSVAELAFEADANGVLTYLWPAEILGWPAASLLGAPGVELLVRPGEDRDPFTPGPSLRQCPVRLRARDGRAVTLGFTTLPIPGPIPGPISGPPPSPAAGPASPPRGMRGLAMVVRDMPANEPPPRGPLTTRLETMLWRMHGQVLPSATIEAGLHELVTTLGAEGAMLLQATPRTDRSGDQQILFGNQQDGPDATVRYRAGTVSTELVGALLEVAASLASGQSTPWQRRMTLAGRERVLCGAPDRLGGVSVVAVWPRIAGAAHATAATEWCEANAGLISSLTAVLCCLLEQDQLAQEIGRQARTDALTGLLRRDAFAEEVERRFDRLDRGALPGTLLVIDLIGFRHVNDLHGPELGDSLLRQTAVLLRDAVRATDLVARLGGDVFAAWLDGADRFAAAERAEHLCACGLPADRVLREDATALPPPVPEMTIGMALRAPRGFEGFESLLSRSLAALSQSKSRCHEITTPGVRRANWIMSREDPLP